METAVIGESEFLGCCGSTRFGREMAKSGPFTDYEAAVVAARDIWFNKVDVNGWLEAFSAHPQIGQSPSSDHKSLLSARWSKGEQSTAIATATDFDLQELYDWNVRYEQKFGFVFLIFASGRSTPEILAELKKRFINRPIVELENAANEQMKITELRLAKLFSLEPAARTRVDVATKAGEDRVSIIGSHLTNAPETCPGRPSTVPARTRPPITTHVLDTSRGSPASGVEVTLEKWADGRSRPVFAEPNTTGWVLQGRSATDKDGRAGQLMSMVDALEPGFYRISFNTGKYNPEGFFPYVSVLFESRESQKWEHFHVPLLLSPFSFSTYRGS